MAVNVTRLPAAERVTHGIARYTLRHRWATLAVLAAITIFFGYHARKVQMYSQFADLLPQAHPYIKAYNHFRTTFGGANIVSLSLRVKEGDIFNTDTLKKIRYVTEKVDQIDGVNHYQVASLAHVKIRRLEARSGGLIKSVPVLPEQVPTDPKDLAELKKEMYNNDIVYGKYLSTDGKAALVLAGFNEERLDYGNIQHQIMLIRQHVEDKNTVLYAAGEPMLKGWVWFYTGELAEIFAVTFLFIFGTLVIYFRRLYGVLLPFVGAIAQALWGLGFLGILGYNLDPLVLVIPLLVSARAASHGVQMVERYFEELEATGDKHHAVAIAMGELLLPGGIGVLADAAGILVLGVATIPLVRKLAFFASFWGFSNIFTILLLIPLLLDVLPRPSKTAHYVPQWMHDLLAWVGEFCTSRRGRWAVFAISAVIVAAGAYEATSVQIGETEAGSPLLFPNSDFNISARAINADFAGSNQLVIYLKGDRDDALKDPAVLSVLDNLRHYMMEQTEAGGTRDLPTLVRSVNRLYHYDDPVWAVIPRTEAGVGNMTFMYEANAPVPGVILEYMDFHARDGQFVVFYKDAKGTTIDEAIMRTKLFMAAHPMKDVKFVLAGGTIGTTAALNDEVAYSDRVSTILIVAVVFALVTLSYMSFVAGGMVMITLVAAGIVSFLYIGLKGIGMNINTLPVTAVGMGIGVDYILYVVDRIKREYGRLHDHDAAIKRAIATSGMAVTFTATTLVGGVIPWVWMSDLRFSAEMAMLLALLMITHWLSAITLVPSIFAIFRPKFVERGAEVSDEDLEMIEKDVTAAEVS
ncbi:MAG TPA: MMPL family transporter [Candidatus Binataceae bacterium]|nr:MMPL family transporter [Candidatus Binataceae bacterium]